MMTWRKKLYDDLAVVATDNDRRGRRTAKSETAPDASRDAIEFPASEWDCGFMVGFLRGNIDETSASFEGHARVHAD
jgi:hypothetical protein